LIARRGVPGSIRPERRQSRVGVFTGASEPPDSVRMRVVPRRCLPISPPCMGYVYLAAFRPNEGIAPSKSAIAYHPALYAPRSQDDIALPLIDPLIVSRWPTPRLRLRVYISLHLSGRPPKGRSQGGGEPVAARYHWLPRGRRITAGKHLCSGITGCASRIRSSTRCGTRQGRPKPTGCQSYAAQQAHSWTSTALGPPGPRSGAPRCLQVPRENLA